MTIQRAGTPLSPGQRAMWASQRRHPTVPLLNAALVARLPDSIDADRLSASFDHVVGSTPVLRRVLDDRPSGAVWVEADGPSNSSDRHRLDRVDADRLFAARAEIALDPRRSVFESIVVEHPDGTVSWFLNLHHIVTDASTSALVFEQTMRHLVGETAETGQSYDQWIDAALDDDSAAAERGAAHWVGSAWADGRGPEALRRLYRDGDRHSTEVTRHHLGAVERWQLPDGVASFSEELAWTNVLATLAACWISKVAAVDEVTIGVPVHHRRGRAARGVVGPLLEIAPLRVQVDGSRSVRELHDDVAGQVRAAIAASRPGRTPAAEVDAVVNVITHAPFRLPSGERVDVDWFHSGHMEPSTTMRLQVESYGGAPSLLVDLADAVAPPAEAEPMAQLGTLLQALVDEDPAPLGALDVVPASEAELLAAWGRGGPPPEAPLLLDQLATLSASSRPAVDAGPSSMTGAQLWHRAGRWAVEIDRRLAGRPEARVAVELPRGAAAVTALLAVLRAGRSYVPIDPRQPAARRARLVERADAGLVIDVGLAEELDVAPDAQPPSGLAPSAGNEAYLLFTSGSTGEPKGVPITHRGLADYVANAVHHYVDGLAPDTIVAPLFSALTFDLTVTTVFAPLVAGGTVVPIETDGPEGLAEIAARSDLTWMKATPSHLDILCRLEPRARLQRLVVGGEQFSSALALRLRRTFGDQLRVFNEYGPTEAVVGCMIHEWSPADPERDVLIGRPLPGVDLMVVGADDVAAPLGAAGELLISHRGVTAGYLDAEHDAGSFVELRGRRWYRSGDLVRLVDPDRAIYLGRGDEQMKVGGVRLEPSEIEAAIAAHPDVAAVAVRQWSPPRRAPQRHCRTCGIADNVPGVHFDHTGLCHTCLDFESIVDQTAEYFGDLDELRDRLTAAQARRTGDHDVLHLLSGGKDSTYALHRLVELGFRPYVLTLDNGFISEHALDNVRRSMARLDVDGEVVTSAVMNDVFRASLERFSNVCHGCYKLLYTLAGQKAAELGIPVIMTGLSRGQLFETRLAPHQFVDGAFDPAAIDAAVLAARKSYHRLDDSVNRLLDNSVFDDGFFDAVEFVDFYRYADVPLSEMLDTLETSGVWQRPSDTGRSTNCLVNAAGIHTHLEEQGFHNYAIPYAWDVRLGHKTREEAMAELDDENELGDVATMLHTIGYRPTRRTELTAWVVPVGDRPVDPGRLRAHAAATLPAVAVPSAFVEIDELPTTANGKLDVAALPAPERIARSAAMQVPPSTALERVVVEEMERVLGVQPVSVDDDFFAIGGDSLAGLELAARLRAEGLGVTDAAVFASPTARALAVLGELDDVSRPVARPDDEPPAFTAGEAAMLFEHQAAPEGHRYNVARDYWLSDHADGVPVDLDRLVSAVVAVAARHTPFEWTFETPRRRRRVEELASIDMDESAVSDDAFERLSLSMQQQPFVLEARPGEAVPPALRVVARRRVVGGAAICIAMHHIAIDAGTFDVFWNQVEAEYLGDAPPAVLLDAAAPDHSDVVAWQESQADVTPWLEDMEPVAELDLGRSRPDRDGLLERRLDHSAADLSIDGRTPFATVFAAFAMALRRRAVGDRVPIGVISSIRNDVAMDHLVGYHLNTVPTVVDVGDTGTTPREVLDTATAVTHHALAHRATPTASIVSAVRQAGGAPPDLRVLIALERFAPASLGDASARPHVRWSGQAVTDLTLFVQVFPDDRVAVLLEHSGSAIDRTGAERLLDDVLEFVRVLAAGVDVAHRFVPLPSDVAASAAVSSAPTSTLSGDVAAALQAQPSSTAVIAADGSMGAGDLDVLADAFAAEAARLTAPGDTIAVIARRTRHTVAAMTGVQRAGRATLAVDPAYPPRMLASMVADAKVACVVAGRADAELLERIGLGAAEILDVELTAPARSADPGDAPMRLATPEDPAYVIFTSGSTGVPKGVRVTQANISFSNRARALAYPTPPGRFLLVSPLAFDSSMVGLWWPLVNGGTVVLPEDGRHDDVDHLLGLITEHGVTHTLMLPSLYEVLLEAAGPGELDGLETVIVAGEACPAGLVASHTATAPGALLANEYGPTEGTVWSHRSFLDDPEDITIGSVLPGGASCVVDDDLLPRPTGVPGELLIAGANVTSGYLDRPDETERRFVEVGGRRWYRTGDLVDVDEAGVHRFHGRVDDQVKIRGHRIELEAVDAALAGLPNVEAAAAAVTDSPARLVASVVLTGSTGGRRDEARLRALAASVLPAAAVPSHIQVVDSLRRHPNGKVDRRAVAQLAFDPADAHDPDASQRHLGRGGELLREAWATVLGRAEVGDDDDFFDFGGDSIGAIRMAAMLRPHGLTFAPRDVFDHPTPSALAERLRPLVPADPPMEGAVTDLPIVRWFRGGLAAGIDADRFAQSIRVSVRPDLLDSDRASVVAVLPGALGDVLAHHEALRLRMTETTEVGAAEAWPFAEHPGDDAAVAWALDQLDLARGRLVAAAAVSAPEADEQGDDIDLLLLAHHAAVDTVSWSIIVDDLHVALSARLRDRRPSLAGRATSLQAWAQYLADAGHPADAGVPAAVQASSRPTLRARASGRTSWISPVITATEDTTRVVEHLLSVEATDRLRGLDVTIDEAVALALTSVVPDHAPELVVDDLLAITLERHGRETPPALDLTRTVGWFTATQRYEPSIAAGGGVEALREQLDTVPASALVDSRLVAAGAAPAETDVIRINHQGTAPSDIDAPGAVVWTSGPQGHQAGSDPRRHRLGVMSATVDGRLRLVIDHAPGDLAPVVVDRLVDALVGVLEADAGSPPVEDATGVEGTTGVKAAQRDGESTDFELAEMSSGDLAALEDLLSEL